jgi:hypothetical protein
MSKKQKPSLLILTSAIILISSCAANTIPVPVKLDLPPALVLPKVAGPLDCLSSDVYETLVIRDRMQTERITTLESIIKSTHN